MSRIDGVRGEINGRTLHHPVSVVLRAALIDNILKITHHTGSGEVYKGSVTTLTAVPNYGGV